MKITKEWEKLLTEICKLIGMGGILDLELTIPEELFFEVKQEWEESQNKKLSYCHIELKAVSYCSGLKVSTTTKIRFGPKRSINQQTKEIVIEFKYASKIVLYLIHFIQPSELSIKTNNLYEAKKLLSKPISTLDHDFKI